MSQDSPAALSAVAVIGLAGRFPGARTADAFWRNLADGVESITFFTPDELRLQGVEESWLTDRRYVRANGALADIDLFDAELFDFTPREAEITDPQHRVLLECAWESLENAGYDPDRFAGRIGVYAGAGISTYLVRNLLGGAGLPPGVSDLQVSMGNNKDHVPTRISYKLNLKGPSINVNTACSTSLVAVHLACQGLLDYHCDIALAGGVGIQVPQLQGYWYEDGGIGSPDGHCRAFDARAAGTVSGNGAGLVVLKRLADASADGDCIRAVIRSSAVNNDGRSKAGYTAPSVQGQAEVIAEALALAGVDADSIGYVEAHGTGTALGDPIEIAALTQAFRAGSSRRQFCAIGSVKTNIGHLDEAAGVAGLIKTVFALEEGKLPPSLHYEQPNPSIDFAASPFFVNTRLADWAASPRRAGVSSFGLGGTNAHVILEQAPARPVSVSGRRWHLLPLSSRSTEALDAAAANLAHRVRQQLQAATDGGAPEGGAWLADAGYTLSVGRRAFLHRRMVVSDGMEAALGALQSGDSRATFTSVNDSQPRPVVFLFPGQGAQHVRMAFELYRHECSFRRQLDHCADILRQAFGYDFRDWLYPPDGADAGDAAVELGRTAVAQPVLFSIEYALARLLMAWGIQPHAMIGHSLGEYVAACLAGVFPVEEGLKLVAARGALMERLGGGGMLSVPLPEAESRAMLPPDLWVAAANSPCLTTVSGPVQAVRAFQQRLADRGIGSHLLATSHAFHSGMIDPILPSLLDLMKTVRLRPPALAYVSNVTGDWITAAQATDPMYWAAHSRQTVRFAAALEKVFGGAHPVLLEVGPGRNLASAASRHTGKPAAQPVYTTLPHPHDGEPDDKVFLSAVGRLWTDGVPIDWTAFYADERRHRIPLPAQPFNRQRYWIEGRPPPAVAGPEFDAPPPRSADKLADIARWFYVPSWQRSVLPAPPAGHLTGAAAGRWLLFVDDGGVGRELARRLEQQAAEVITVSRGPRFEQVTSREFVLDPGRSEQYESLVTALTSGGGGFARIVHLWSLDADRDPRSWPQAQDRGFYSLLFLVQALHALPVDRQVRIDVISSGIHDVIGGERLHPAAATILGPVRVVPQECPGIACRSIDIALDHADAPGRPRLIERLSQELAGDPRDSVVAWRGPHRWTQRFEPVRLEGTSAATSRLKAGGAYLITGGLGGVGTILAEYLAREFKARLALVSRVGLPSERVPALVPDREGAAVHDIADAPVRDRRFALADRAGAIADASDRIARDVGPRLISDYTGFVPAANELCASYIYDYFSKIARPDRGRVMSRPELDRALRIQPRFAKLLDFFLRVLRDQSIVRASGDGAIEFLRHPAEIADPQSARAALVQRFPDFTGVLSLLDHCVRHYPAALSGEIAPIDVLYPGGSTTLLEEAGRGTPFRTHRDVYIGVLKEIIDEVCRRSPGQPVRILEVGIGDGILTRAIAPGLPPDTVEYWATDIGRTFVVRGEQEAARAGLDFLHFEVFDIARGPAPAAIARGGFDFVLGLDVVHATPRIGETLTRLNRLLAPGGVLALIETVGTHPWVDMIWGLADGWWSFEDHDLRQSPLLGVAEWEAVLGRSGFASVQAHPLDRSSRDTADFGLILGQKSTGESAPSTIPSCDSVTVARIRNVRKLEELGSDVLVLAADVGDEAQMKAAVAAARQRFGRIDGVIHAAGVTRGDIVFNLLDETTRASAEALFRSKIQGSLVLARVLGDEPLDFCLVISSNAAILGGLGLSAYAACNVFVDAFATAQSTTTGQHWISANWDGWPTEDVSAGTARFQTSIDRFAMTRAECEQAFERVLLQSSPHIVVSSADLKTRLQLWTSPAAGSCDGSTTGIRQPATAADGPAPASRNRVRSGASPLHQRPNLSSEYVPAVTVTEQRLCRIWQELFAIDRIGIDDNFFELRGDSLLGTQLIAIASREFGIPIPIRSIFEHSSISRLSKVIDEKETAAALLSLVPAHPLSDDEEEGSL